MGVLTGDEEDSKSNLSTGTKVFNRSQICLLINTTDSAGHQICIEAIQLYSSAATFSGYEYGHQSATGIVNQDDPWGGIFCIG